MINIIELNCITCAGMYACDLEKFILNINEMVDKNE